MKLIGFFRYFKQSRWALALILAMLALEAACDLALPSLTSGIVDVGILRGGIADAVPESIRPATLERLAGLMDAEGASAARAAYAPAGDGAEALALKPMGAGERQALSRRMEQAMAALAAQEAGGAGQDGGGAAAGAAGAGGGAGQAADSAAQPADSAAQPADSAAQAAARFVAAEYEAQGIDLQGVQSSYIKSAGARMLGFTFLSALAAIVVSLVASVTGAGLAMELRERVYAKTMTLSGAEIDRFTVASLITRNTNDIQQIQSVVVLALRMLLYAPIICAGGAFMVLRARSGLGWIVIAAAVVINAMLLAVAQVVLPTFKVQQALIDRLNLVSREILTGIPVIRAFGRERHEERLFGEANMKLSRTQLFVTRVMSTMNPVMTLVLNGVTVLIVWFGARGIQAGGLQVGGMMAFITYTIMIVMSFMMISTVGMLFPRASVAADRVAEVLEAVPSVRDGGGAGMGAAPGAAPGAGPGATPGASPGAAPGARQAESPGAFELRFEDVSFRYPGAQEDALRNVTFTAPQGKTTAVIGSTGSGKTTLVNLIPRFHDATGGRVTIGGVDVRDMRLADLRGMLGFVPQKAVLFRGDVASNIRFGDAGLSDAAMEEAAVIAQAAGFVAEKEGGFHAPIAQGGSNVSGGQKQRLSIARAIARGPKIFVFDDSFSALDYKTDAALRRALAARMGGAAVVIVAQRVSTILRADLIVVLEDGRVMGQGTHRELFATCPTYREIAASQLSEAELAREMGLAGLAGPAGTDGYAGPARPAGAAAPEGGGAA